MTQREISVFQSCIIKMSFLQVYSATTGTPTYNKTTNGVGTKEKEVDSIPQKKVIPVERLFFCSFVRFSWTRHRTSPIALCLPSDILFFKHLYFWEDSLKENRPNTLTLWVSLFWFCSEESPLQLPLLHQLYYFSNFLLVFLPSVFKKDTLSP